MPLPIRSWLREPFVHFLALGALLFVLHAAVAPSGLADSDKTVRITQGDVRRIAAAWELQWRRPPTENELANLLREHVREEILYREALALGLDRDDSIVRRRLAQKMEFLSQDTATEQEPTEAQLREFFDAHGEQFRTPANATFSHIYFSPDKRGPDVRQDAAQALTRLRAGESIPGDPFMLQSRYAERTEEQIAGLFGQAFAESVFDLPTSSWQGPVESGYGLHLVRVEAKNEARPTSFNGAEADVRAAWFEQARSEANDLLYRRLRQDYSIETDPSVSEIASEIAMGEIE